MRQLPPVLGCSDPLDGAYEDVTFQPTTEPYREGTPMDAVTYEPIERPTILGSFRQRLGSKHPTPWSGGARRWRSIRFSEADCAVAKQDAEERVAESDDEPRFGGLLTGFGRSAHR